MRMREYSEAVPKPMVPIGYRPILWHVMKYYAHYGHKDFILCLGYKADVIKKYFLVKCPDRGLYHAMLNYGSRKRNGHSSDLELSEQRNFRRVRIAGSR